MKKYITGEKHSFHTPGHKAGRAFDEKFRKFMQDNLFALDITATPFVDSIHNPSATLLETQRRISRLYETKDSFILTNGSTSGNLAAFISLFSDGDSVLISRNSHKSVIAACIISGVYPVWMTPRIIKNGITCEVNSEDVERYLNSYPEAKGVFITSPTYHGIITDLENIAKVCRKYKKLMIVDEAWGPHLFFSGDKTLSAVNYADCVIHSFHKILPVFSQGSVIHICSDVPDRENVEKAVSLLTSTSPFYPTLMTLDYCSLMMKRKGARMVEKMQALGNLATSDIRKIPLGYALDSSDLPEDYRMDTSKVTVDFRDRGLTGFFIQNYLMKFGIGVDCANPLNVIATLGLGNNKGDITALTEALKTLPIKKPIKFTGFRFPETPAEIALTPREVYMQYTKKKMLLSESEGQICAETIAPYPPGIPVLLPGERITAEVIEYLEMIDRFKWSVFRHGKKTKNKLEFISVIEV
ncbi:aminotransferase class I/II-fold pyridoxal phosphate-dependent enzyme [bacterium]|nr:aminotransferase class I/II-fold pyridoxal phosphate-dependent enzyme [bacterium]